MQASDIQKAMHRCYQEHGVLGVSVYAADVPDLRSLLEQTPKPERWRRISVGEIGVLRDLGFEDLPTGDTPHFTLVLPDVAPATIEALRAAFRQHANPLYRRAAP